MTNNNIYFIANWKMYGHIKSLNSVKKVIKLSKDKKYRKAKIIYCPPFTLLNEFSKLIQNTSINIGAQDCHHNEYHGPYTGSISPNMIKNSGSQYVIVGHSENRFRGDNDSIINKKIISSLRQGLKVIFCIGESLNEKKKNKTNLVIKKQILKGLRNIKNTKNIFFAYEPIWSIGTGIIPKQEDLSTQTKYILNLLKKKFGNKNPVILYGGSVNSKNIIILKQIRYIKGFLIGGSSQNSNKFIDIIKKTII